MYSQNSGSSSASFAVETYQYICRIKILPEQWLKIEEEDKHNCEQPYRLDIAYIRSMTYTARGHKH